MGPLERLRLDTHVVGSLVKHTPEAFWIVDGEGTFEVCYDGLRSDITARLQQQASDFHGRLVCLRYSTRGIALWPVGTHEPVVWAWRPETPACQVPLTVIGPVVAIPRAA